MSLLREIQEAATSEQTSLTVVLRKCKILAARLSNRPLGDWVERELNGYVERNSVPHYRVLKGLESRGDFSGPFDSGMRNAPIPPFCLPEKLRENRTTAYLMDGIATYEDLLRTSAEGFRIPWPADLTAALGREIYTGMNCMVAWQDVARGRIVNLVETVKNRVLGFAIEIEATAPAAGEAAPGVEPVSQDKVNQVFNTVVLGGTNTIAAGSPHATIQTAIVVQPADVQSLVRHLEALGLSRDDTRELAEAVQADPQPTSDEGFGPRVAQWLGRMVGKAASGAWKIGSSVASEVLTKALLKYYGL